MEAWKFPCFVQNYCAQFPDSVKRQLLFEILKTNRNPFQQHLHLLILQLPSYRNATRYSATPERRYAAWRHGAFRTAPLNPHRHPTQRRPYPARRRRLRPRSTGTRTSWLRGPWKNEEDASRGARTRLWVSSNSRSVGDVPNTRDVGFWSLRNARGDACVIGGSAGEVSVQFLDRSEVPVLRRGDWGLLSCCLCVRWAFWVV